ncbi:hypothetical protein IEO21_05803 [Rhodonia placenta]|uniref:Uncharacterized protein n=1 Tax=Rhodonia placenta TaxID=104341 RepID=A0A8H7P166_9APHY|nr:hypothetical protein IEO21_05803 [Postia placenta]
MYTSILKRELRCLQSLLRSVRVTLSLPRLSEARFLSGAAFHRSFRTEHSSSSLSQNFKDWSGTDLRVRVWKCKKYCSEGG